MEAFQKSNHVLSLGLNRMLIDLLFDVTAGEQVDLEWSYEEQLEYYKKLILPEQMDFSELMEYGNKYKLTWKFLFPAKPEKVKKRLFLIKLFSSYVLLNEIAKCNDFELVSNANKLTECVTTKITFSNEEEQSIYTKEVQYLAKQYAETLTKEDYNEFLAIMTKVSEEFEQIYNIVVTFVLGEEATKLESTGIKSVFSILLDTYQIPVSDATKFRLEADAIIETTIIKNEHLEYMEELKAEWGIKTDK